MPIHTPDRPHCKPLPEVSKFVVRPFGIDQNTMPKCRKTTPKGSCLLQEEFDDYGCSAHQTGSCQKGCQKCADTDLPCFSNQLGHFGAQLFVSKFNFSFGQVVHTCDCPRLNISWKPTEIKVSLLGREIMREGGDTDVAVR